ncbi:MAG: hypothetical protein H7Y03_10335, partial [Chitinophagaceae bacterium]|nr:hypothetical protein [Chitinophagaceae bacterium]
MKYNKLAIIFRNGLFILLMIAGISSFAQKKTPEERARMVTDSMKTTLTLSDDQYQKAYNANLSFMSGAASL